jgi:hypothetical protein
MDSSAGSRPPHRRDWILGAAIAALVGLAYLPFLYDGLVEADSVQVGRGIVHAIRSGEGLAARDLYGRTFSFGYYGLFIALYPLLFQSFGPLVATMNGLNLACTALSFLPMFLWMSQLWGRAVGGAAAALLATTPVVFELGGYGHPEGPAFLALNVALALFLRGIAPGQRSGPLLAGALACAFAAATLRADVLFGFPLFVLLAPIAAGPGRGWRAFMLGAGVTVLATAGFFAAQAVVVAMIPPRITPIPGGTFTGQLGLFAFFGEYWKIAKQTQSLAKGIAVWATGLGPLLLAAGLLGTLAAFGRRRTFAWAAVTILVVNGVFWLPDPTPSRHLLMTFLVLAPAAALLLGDLVPRRRFAVTVVLLAALNLASMAAAYPIVVGNYAFKFVTLLPRRVNTWVPMGDPISNRIWAQRQVELETAEARQLAASDEPKLLVFGSFVTPRLLYELYAFAPSYQIEYTWRHGALFAHATTPKTDYWIYDYSAEPTQITPSELMQAIAAAGDFKDFAIALIPSDQPVAGAAEVPPGYRAFEFNLDQALGARLASRMMSGMAGRR